MSAKQTGIGPPDLPESLRGHKTRMDAGSHDSLANQLLELQSIQDARIAAEEEARLKAAEEARRREEAEAKRRREEEEARLAAEEEARLAAERAAREEEERRVREAKEAELRVQLEEQAKARAAEQERLLAHEKEIAAITAAERSKARNRKIAIGSMVAVLLAALGSYAFLIKPALERKALEAELARQEQQMALEQK
ncbi:MAG: hypothetical protein WBN38_02820, partial [Polyangiales bacterium]